MSLMLLTLTSHVKDFSFSTIYEVKTSLGLFFFNSRMMFGLLVVFFSLVDAQAPVVIGSHEPVHVRVGEDAILPCHLEPPFDVNRLTVEWRWNGKYVYIYRSEEPDLVNQDELFKGRTSLFPEEMKKGNISLKVTKVTEVHAGSYSCFVPQLESQVKKGKVILIVDPVENNKDENQIKDSSSPADPHPPESGHTGIGTDGIIGGVAALLVLNGVVALIWWRVRRRRRRANEGNVMKCEEIKRLNSLRSTEVADCCNILN